jgi:hypothetical protein
MLLPGLFSVTVPVPALTVDVPTTVRGPTWVMPPLPLLAPRAPPTVLVPRFSAPVLLTVKLPVVVAVPKVSALASVICAAAAESDTAPVKSLPAWFKFTFRPLALKVLVPVTPKAPVWPISPALVVLRLPVTVVAPKVVVPPLVVVVVRFWVLPETTRLPPALNELLPLAFNAAVSTFASAKLMLPPEAVTVPTKSLAGLVSVVSPVPESKVLLPVTDSAPLWLMSPLPLLALKSPPTVLVPRFKAPVLLTVKLPVVVTVPSVSALASVICAAAAESDTAPVKSLPALLKFTF